MCPPSGLDDLIVKRNAQQHHSKSDAHTIIRDEYFSGLTFFVTVECTSFEDTIRHVIYDITNGTCKFNILNDDASSPSPSPSESFYRDSDSTTKSTQPVTCTHEIANISICKAKIYWTTLNSSKNLFVSDGINISNHSHRGHTSETSGAFNHRSGWSDISIVVEDSPLVAPKCVRLQIVAISPVTIPHGNEKILFEILFIPTNFDHNFGFHNLSSLLRSFATIDDK